MGDAYFLACSRCSYGSDLVCLGQGMKMEPELVIGVCDACHELTQIPIGTSSLDCGKCRSSGSVRKSLSEMPKSSFGLFKTEESARYQCPKCGAFSIEIPSAPEESWD